jgi:formylmethanofuran dehydrogenase subunit E
MQSLDELLAAAEQAHGHLCAGQILGVRMAMLGCALLDIRDPRHDRADRKRLVTFVEIDRCATDAIAVVTGCRLGKRALKFRDWGKMAATFIDLGPAAAATPPAPDFTGSRAVRIAALDSSKDRARELYPALDKNAAQMRAYRELPDSELFSTEWVRVPLSPSEMPGHKSARVTCARCGEGINFAREIHSASGETLCQACASPTARYYQPLDSH